MKIRTLLISAILALMGSPAFSQTQAEKDCVDLSGDARIAACSKIISLERFLLILFKYNKLRI